MSGESKSGGLGCIFWMVIAILVIGPLGTCAVVGIINSRHEKPAGPKVVTPLEAPSANAPVDARVQHDGARICAAYKELAKTLPDDAFNDGAAIWKKLGLSSAPADPWGTPYLWQGWNRSVHSSGPDRAANTGDDQTVRCEG